MSILPPNATALERDLEATTARVGDVPTPLADLWRPQSCPLALLPWLAWALSVDVWDPAWSEAQKRDTVARALAMHQKKGTPWAVKEALRIAGWEGVQLQEGLPLRLYDGSIVHSGRESYGADRWALFRAILSLGDEVFTGDDEARFLRLVLAYKNARSHLESLRFALDDLVEPVTTSDELGLAIHEAARYDGAYDHDGSATYLIATTEEETL